MKVKLLENTKCPKRGRPDDAGYDLFLNKDTVIPAGERVSICTGVCTEIPKGYAGLLVPRSSICMKYPNLELRSPLIDCNYRGEIHAIFVNESEEDIEFKEDERICSLYVFPVYHEELEIVDELSESDRGTSWNGSSGK